MHMCIEKRQLLSPFPDDVAIIPGNGQSRENMGWLFFYAKLRVSIDPGGYTTFTLRRFALLISIPLVIQLFYLVEKT